MRISEDQKKQIVSFLKRHPLTAAYLFGSQADGAAGPLSDVDIALLFPHHFTRHDRETVSTEIFSEMTTLLGTEEIDLVVLETAPVLLRYDIVTRGQLLFAHDKEATDRFRFHVIQQFEDFRFHLDTRRRLLQQRYAV